MHKFTGSQSDQLKSFSQVDQKMRLQQMLRERYSKNGIKQRQQQQPNFMLISSGKDVQISSIPDKKQYASQATQIQEDLFSNDTNLEEIRKDDQEDDDELNNSYDKSYYHTVQMQSRYKQSIIPSDEPDSQYFMKNKYIKNGWQSQFEDSINKDEDSMKKTMIINKNIPQNLNSVIRRYSGNIIMLKSDKEGSKYLNKHQNVDSTQQFQGNCLPEINNSQQGDSKTNDMKKRIQINHKEVYKLFCSKMKEEENQKKQHFQNERTNLFLSSQYPITSIRNSIYRTNQSKINENSILTNKKIYAFSSTQNEMQSFQNGSMLFKAVSRNPSIEDQKTDYKNWNLAEFSKQISQISAKSNNTEKVNNNLLASSQLYKKYSQRVSEKLEQPLVQQSLDSSIVKEAASRKQSFSLIKRKSIQLELNDLTSNLLDQNYDIHPKRLLKKFFSVKQFSLNSPQRSPKAQNQSNDLLDNLLSIKQVDEKSSLLPSQQKNQKSNSQYNIQLPELNSNLTKKRSSSTNSKKDNNFQNKNIQKFNIKINNDNPHRLFNKQSYENYYQ